MLPYCFVTAEEIPYGKKRSVYFTITGSKIWHVTVRESPRHCSQLNVYVENLELNLCFALEESLTFLQQKQCLQIII
jgi:hypothetical protein